MAPLSLRDLYIQYDKEANLAEQQAPVLSKILSMGNDPRQHHCHKLFYGSVKNWTEEFACTDPTEKDVFDSVWWVLEAASLHRNETTYWYLYSAQKHAELLLTLLSKDSCKTICQWYEKTYPAIDRMPVQDKIYKLLCKCSK